MPTEPGKFKYETLLRVRKRQEDLRAQELAMAVMEQQRARRARADITAEHRRAIEHARRLLEDARINARDMRRYYQYERHLSRLGDAKDAEILALGDVVDERREILAEAMKKRKIFERLREKFILDQVHHQRKSDQTATDEAASIRAALREGRGMELVDRGRQDL